MKNQKTPIDMCNYWKNIALNCYDRLTVLRDHARSEMKVNQECELPLAVAITYLQQEQHYSNIESVRKAPDLTASYIWRQHKIIYDFDDTLAEELCNQADDISEDYTLPIEIILHPPYPCVYIKSSIPTKAYDDMDGFWAWIEIDAITNTRELRIQFANKDFSQTFPAVLELTSSTIGGCVEDTNRTRMRNHPDLYSEKELRTIKVNDKILFRAMQLYLYICSTEADIQDNPSQSKIYRPRTKGQPIKDRFRELEIKDVGIVIGATLRKSRQESVRQDNNIEPHEPQRGQHKRPHTRKGHWHHYWTGSKSQPEQRKLILKWTHPVLVGGYTDNVITMIPVKNK